MKQWYYIYKQLSDGPSQNGEAIKYNFIHLIVINFSIAAQNIEVCMQMTSFGPLLDYPIPGNIGSMPMLRSYNKTSKQWKDWTSNYGISFVNNNIVISDITPANKSNIKFPIIATDNTFPNGNNKFMYSATKAQMRSALGIADQPDLTDYFNKTTDKLDLATQVKGQLKNANIEDNTIITSKIASLAITADKLALSSVTNDKIENGAVTSAKIASKTINASNIAENAITESELDSNAVTNTKISNGAVTDAKFSGTLSISKGGTNATNINEARKNLQTFAQAELPHNSDLNDVSLFLKNNIHIYSNGNNCNNRPHEVNTGQIVTYLDPTYKRGWQRFYPAGVGEEGWLSYWGRVYSNNQWGKWKLMRNSDGSIPADLIPPTILKYTNDQGTWTETKLSDGTTMLEGWGMYSFFNLQPEISNIKKITYPKRMDNTINKIYSNTNWIVYGLDKETYATLKVCSVEPFSDRVEITSTQGNTIPFPSNNIRWYVKGILA